MRYTFFEFTNFKGIRAARIDLSPTASPARVHTLVGLNESGKTTILEAIDQFQSQEAGEVRPKAIGGWSAPDPNSLIPIASRGNFNGEVTIRCGVALDDDDVAAAKRFLRERDGFRLEDLGREVEINDRYLFKDSEYERRRVKWHGLDGTGFTKKGRQERAVSYEKDRDRWQALADFMRGRLPTVWYFPNFLFEFPSKIYLEGCTDEPAPERFYRALFQDVLDALDSGLDIETHVVARARSGKENDIRNLKQVLRDAGRDVTRTVVSSWNEIFKERPIDEKHIRIEFDVDPSPRADEEGEPLPGRPWVRFLIEDTDGFFDISERSLGFRWFFVYLMLTTYRGQRKDSSPEMLFLFDEPASNLHPAAQSALLTSLNRLSRRAVVIYTTHSHHLIEPAWLGTTSVVANAGLGAEAVSTEFRAANTDIQITPYREFASQHPEQSHFFQPILEVLDYAPSSLEMVPGMVMVEGKSDYYLLEYFQSVVLGTPPGERIRLMPRGGAGTLDQVIQLYLGWSRPFIALLDSDTAGRDQTARYLSKFGRIIEPNLISLHTASGKSAAKGIESLLNDAEKLRFQRLIDPHASKLKKKTLALGVQEALVTKTAVALTQATTKTLTGLLASLQTALETVTEDSG